MTGAWIIALAALIDAVIGDPPTWPHLVRYMGRAVDWLECRLRAWCFSPTDLKVAGAILVLAVAGGFTLGALALLVVCAWIAAPLYWLVALVLAWQCLAAGQLWREARIVLDTLRAGDLVYAQGQLAMIVGRDTSRLDEEGGAPRGGGDGGRGLQRRGGGSPVLPGHRWAGRGGGLQGHQHP